MKGRAWRSLATWRERTRCDWTRCLFLHLVWSVKGRRDREPRFLFFFGFLGEEKRRDIIATLKKSILRNYYSRWLNQLDGCKVVSVEEQQPWREVRIQRRGEGERGLSVDDRWERDRMGEDWGGKCNELGPENVLAELSRIMGIPNFIITEEPISIQLIYLNTFFWLERGSGFFRRQCLTRPMNVTWTQPEING